MEWNGMTTHDNSRVNDELMNNNGVLNQLIVLKFSHISQTLMQLHLCENRPSTNHSVQFRVRLNSKLQNQEFVV